MAVEYQKLISTDFPNLEVAGKVDVPTLTSQTIASGIKKALDHLAVSGDICSFNFKETLDSADETELQNVCDTHDGVAVEEDDESIQNVRIIQESALDPYISNTRIEGFVLSIPANSKRNLDISYPYLIDLESGECFVPKAKANDIGEFHVAPDVQIGVITQDALLGATEIFVNSTVLQNVKAGFHVRIGTANDLLHEIASVDLVNSKLVLREALDENKITGEAVLRTIIYAKNILLEANEVVSLGGQMIGTASIPANTVLRMIYTNNESVDKEIRFRLIYKY